MRNKRKDSELKESEKRKIYVQSSHISSKYMGKGGCGLGGRVGHQVIRRSLVWCQGILEQNTEPQIAPDQQGGTLHGSLSQLMNMSKSTLSG